MNVNITVTHTLAPDLIDILKNFSRGAVEPLQTAVVQEAPKAKAAKKELAAVPSTPAPEATDTNTTTEVEISAEVVRAKTAETIQAGKRSEVSQLLTEFGVGKLTELPKDQRSAFYTKLVAL